MLWKHPEKSDANSLSIYRVSAPVRSNSPRGGPWSAGGPGAPGCSTGRGRGGPRRPAVRSRSTGGEREQKAVCWGSGGAWAGRGGAAAAGARRPAPAPWSERPGRPGRAGAAAAGGARPSSSCLPSSGPDLQPTAGTHGFNVGSNVLQTNISEF